MIHDALGRRGSSSPRVPPEADARVFHGARARSVFHPRAFIAQASRDSREIEKTNAPDSDSSSSPRGVPP